MGEKNTFLGSILGRRLFAIFCISSLVPLILMAFVAYTQVKQELEEQARRNIEHSTRSIGMTIYERMLLLSEEFERIGNALQSGPSTNEGLWWKIEDRFLWVIWSQGELYTETIVHSEGARPLAVDSADIPSGPGEIALLVKSGDPLARVYMVMSIADGYLAGEVNTDFLWQIGPGNILPHHTDLVLADESGYVFLSSLGDPTHLLANSPLQSGGSRSDGFTWSADGVDYTARYWVLFMASRFESDSWVVMISRPGYDLFASVATFQWIFPLILILSFLVVVLLSMINIRLILDPLEKLKAGIQQMAGHNFKNRIRVGSNDEFAGVADAFNAMAEKTERHFQAIHTISEIDRAILSSLEPEKIIRKMLDGVQDLLSCSVVVVNQVDPESPNRAICYMRSPLRTAPGLRKAVYFDADELVAMLSGKQYLHFYGSDSATPDYLRFFSGDAEQWVVLPVFADRELAATVNLGYPALASRMDDDIHYAIQMAHQMAVGLANANLVRELDRMNEGALTSLARTVDAKSPWTAGHSERVGWMACQLGETLGMAPPQLTVLHRAALLHDIGKVGISNAILDKPGKLTDGEYDTIKTHPVTGGRILEPVRVFHNIIPVVRQHHERFDGKGYPDGLVGEDIVLEARVMAVADVYDALISERPYRRGWDHEEVVRFIIDNSGSHFDPYVVDAFLKLLAPKSGAPGNYSVSGLQGM